MQDLMCVSMFSGLSDEAEEKEIEAAEQKAESSYIKSSICDYWKGNKVRIYCVGISRDS